MDGPIQRMPPPVQGFPPAQGFPPGQGFIPGQGFAPPQGFPPMQGPPPPGFGGFPGGPNAPGMNPMAPGLPQAPPNAPECQPFSVPLPGNPNVPPVYVLGCMRFFRGFVCGDGRLSQPAPFPTCRLPALNPECPSTLFNLPGVNVQAFGCYGDSMSPTELMCGANIACMVSATAMESEKEEEAKEVEKENESEKNDDEGNAEHLLQHWSVWKLIAVAVIGLVFLPFQ